MDWMQLQSLQMTATGNQLFADVESRELIIPDDPISDEIHNYEEKNVQRD